QDAIRQLNQRITFHYHLGPLSRDDMEFYVSHRLTVAGFAGSRLFNRGAIRALYAASGGLPRLVNILAHKSMMLAYGAGKQQVTARHVKAAVSDTSAAGRKYRPLAWLAVVSVLVAGTGLAWAYFL
ncbi:MAG: biosis protein MshM, partial [Burkholderiales bacterium]